jgi:hypothetical protein
VLSTLRSARLLQPAEDADVFVLPQGTAHVVLVDIASAVGAAASSSLDALRCLPASPCVDARNGEGADVMRTVQIIGFTNPYGDFPKDVIEESGAFPWPLLEFDFCSGDAVDGHMAWSAAMLSLLNANMLPQLQFYIVTKSKFGATVAALLTRAGAKQARQVARLQSLPFAKQTR